MVSRFRQFCMINDAVWPEDLSELPVQGSVCYYGRLVATLERGHFYVRRGATEREKQSWKLMFKIVFWRNMWVNHQQFERANCMGWCCSFRLSKYIWLNMSDLMERETTFFLLECLRLATPRCFSLALFPHAVGIGGRSRVTVHRHMFDDVTMMFGVQTCTPWHPNIIYPYLPNFFLLHGCSKGMRKFPWMSGQMWLSHLGGRFRLFVSIGGTLSSQGVIGSTFAGSFDLEFGTYYWKEQSGSQGDLTWLRGRTFLHRWISHVKCTEWCLRVPYFETNPYGGIPKSSQIRPC